ncbi:hypothetical protein HDV01_000010 [Terramyces sp. JEL0728]|nr:hypothetical protein HDV01_000010 [Terramyces sp. JEL0728]
MYRLLVFLISYDVFVVTGFAALAILNFIADIQLLLIVLSDIEILRIFSVFNHKITHKRLDVFRNTTVTLFILFPLLTRAIATFIIIDWVNVISDIAIGIFALFGVIYDNGQSFYLLYTIYQFKESRIDSKLSVSMIKRFKELILYLIGMLVIDWIGIGFFVYYTITPIYIFEVDYYNYVYKLYYDYASMICICVHSLGMIYCLIKLKELSLSQNADFDKSIPAQTVPMQMLLDLKNSGAANSVSNQYQKTAIISRN